MVLSMDRWVGKVAVVTGASAGIGAAIAVGLAEKGLKVAALARRKDLLDELAKKHSDKKGKIFPIQVDMSKEDDIIASFAWITQNLGPIHVLVNNAGTAIGKNLLDGDSEAWRKIFDVNVIGLCLATREAIKDMKSNNVDGHIIHINSILGHSIIPFPGVSVYPGSKYAVTALAEVLRLELGSIKSKIKITSLSPGMVDTDIFPQEFRITEMYKRGIEQRSLLIPEDIADGVVYALSTPPHVQIQELTIRPILE